MRTLELKPLVRKEEKKEGCADGYSSEEKKMSYFNVVGSTPLLGMTIGKMIDRSATKFGDTEALIVPFQNIRKTFKQIKEEVDNMARRLRHIGMKKGERLGLISVNTYEYYITQLAAWKAGLVLVSINAAYQSRELLYCINKVGIKCIVISRVFRSQNYYDILVRAVPQIPDSEPGSLKSNQAPDLQFVISVEPNLKGTLSFAHVMNIGANNILTNELDTSVIQTQFDDVCALFFTSGTTGSPKAVCHSHHSLVNNGIFVGKRLMLNNGNQEKICLPVPLFHVYGCLIGTLASLYYGTTVVMPSYGYDTKAIAQTCASEKCTILIGTPTMAQDLVKATEKENYDLKSLHTLMTGGAVCSLQALQDIKAKLPFKNIYNNYGMTEVCCAYSSLPDDPESITSTCVGFPADHIEVKLVDKAGQIVEIGQEGELCVRGYGVMQNYWGDMEKTNEVLEHSKWFHTGDVFIMKETGHGQIVGRIKEMINRGGENVYPKEVEDFLRTHPKISDANVFGVPDIRMGEEPAVWIQVKDGQILTSDEVKNFCRGQTPLGKVQKFRMREETVKLLKL